ncbi:MAG: competence/damage-inducible protein A [bacterium]
MLCIGSELLLGETVNTNASYISKKLMNLGINCYYHTVVGDNPDRIKKVLDSSIQRSDIIITTGGLGPTDDDITVQTFAEYFDEELIFDEKSLHDIEIFFKSINKSMPESSKKQAFIPKNAIAIPNPVGTAPGIIWEISKNKSKKIILCFPGVPEELYAMWERTAENYLMQYSEGVLITRHLKYLEIPEAALAEKVRDIMEMSNPTIAPLVSKGEATLRIAAKAKTREEANILIDEVEKEILCRTKEHFCGYKSETLEEIVGKLLLDKKLSVATAESCTGGLVSSRLTDISGSSGYTKLNLVTYSNESKIKNLGVIEKIIEKYGAVSDKAAISMAEGVRIVSKCDIGIGITGIAGPTGDTETKPIGLVYIALCNKYNLEAHKLEIPSNLPRKEIKYRASEYTLNYLRSFIKKYY